MTALSPLTSRQLNRTTLARQLLLRRERTGLRDAVRRLVALQAQHAASPYLALWNRLHGFDPADLDAAFSRGELVKATLMRITLHVVDPDDHALVHTAMQPTLRGARLGDRRFTVSGLTWQDADAVVGELLDYAREPRTGPDLEAWVGDRLDVPGKSVWWALRSYAPLFHAPTGGPWSFGQRPAFRAAVTSPVPYDRDDADAALVDLVHRYLAGFGPATMPDVAQFLLVQRARAKEALAALDGRLTRLEGPDGSVLFDVPDAPLASGDEPAPARLLPMWDNVLLAYADRSRVIPPDYRKLVTRSNGDVLPTLLVDGQVAGVWRPVDGAVEATAFHELPEESWAELAGEARSLLALIADREPGVYRRYDRWWQDLPGAHVRLLPAG